MAHEQTNQPSRADDYRKAAVEYVDDWEQFQSDEAKVNASLKSSTLALWSIAAELAEANSRDTEAEIRAKTAEAFVAGIQEELRRQGIVMSASVPNVKPPRGR